MVAGSAWSLGSGRLVVRLVAGVVSVPAARVGSVSDCHELLHSMYAFGGEHRCFRWCTSHDVGLQKIVQRWERRGLTIR